MKNMNGDSQPAWMPHAEFLQRIDPLPSVYPKDWQGKPVPPREWLVDGFIPHRVVTLFSGDGGSGKTQLAIQLCVAAAFGQRWMGKSVTPGSSLIFTSEDDENELHRRFAITVDSMGRQLSELDSIQIIAMAGLDSVLAKEGNAGSIELTAQYHKLRLFIYHHKPRFVIIDTSADVFDGNEIVKKQVRAFIKHLSKLALEFDCAVILCSHPSVNGILTGTGMSGNSAWSNSVRSRLYLRPVANEPDRRVVEVMKANYGRPGETIDIVWRDGVFTEFAVDDAAVSMANRQVDDVFMKIFWKLTSIGHKFSPKRSNAYAPTNFAKHPDAGGYSKTKLEQAMNRLLESGTLKIEEQGPPTRRTSVLVASVQ